MFRRTVFAFFIILCLAPLALMAEETRLLRNPDISDSHVAFVYANDIWVASLNGGEARRLTSFPGAASLLICDTVQFTIKSFCPTGRSLFASRCRAAFRLPLVARGKHVHF